jgi:TRAP-type C4-dicarboxylate transport system permease small subunit
MRSEGNPRCASMQKEGNALEKALNTIKTINFRICNIAMVVLFILMFLTTIDTITRKTPLGGIPDSMDFTEIFMVLIVFCGLAYLESEGGHIRVDMIVNAFPRIGKKIIEVVTYLLGAAILFALFYSMMGNITSTYHSGAATQLIHVPQWPFVVIVTAGILMYAITVLFNGIAILIKKDEESSK